MSDRERDAIAAVKLHGWQHADNPSVVDGRGGRGYWLNEKGVHSKLPHYHTDASDDYLSLAVVKEWGEGRRWTFKRCLAVVQFERTQGRKYHRNEEYYAASQFVDPALDYVAGDFTLAAMAALETEEQCKS